MTAHMLNNDGKFVPGIPYPLALGLRYQCNECKKKYWTFNGYQGHYALVHILALERY